MSASAPQTGEPSCSVSAATLARLDAWLAACDRALADGACPLAVLLHVQRTLALAAADLPMAHVGLMLDLDAAYQPGAWRLPRGCETP